MVSEFSIRCSIYADLNPTAINPTAIMIQVAVCCHMFDIHTMHVNPCVSYAPTSTINDCTYKFSYSLVGIPLDLSNTVPSIYESSTGISPCRSCRCTRAR